MLREVRNMDTLTMPDGTYWGQIMFVVREWTKNKRYTHDGKFGTYHEANERAKELGPACFPPLETE